MRPSRYLPALAVAFVLLTAPAVADIPKQPPAGHHEPCWAVCVKRVTLKPGQTVRWTMRQHFRVDREQAFSLYIGKSHTNRLIGADFHGCTYYSQGRGVLLRVRAAGCKTKRRVTLSLAVVSIRPATTRVRVALVDRPYPELPPPVVEEPVTPVVPGPDAWGHLPDDPCYGLDPGNAPLDSGCANPR